MSKVTIMDHPLIQHKIGLIRRKETGSKDFRQLISEIAMLMCYEATRDLKLTDVEIDTPISHMTAKELAGKKLAVVPILRAGLGMVDGMLTMIPAAKVGHIGLYRNEETLEPVEYYCKLPQDCAERDVFVVDVGTILYSDITQQFSRIRIYLGGKIGFRVLQFLEGRHKSQPAER